MPLITNLKFNNYSRNLTGILGSKRPQIFYDILRKKTYSRLLNYFDYIRTTDRSLYKQIRTDLFRKILQKTFFFLVFERFLYNLLKICGLFLKILI